MSSATTSNRPIPVFPGGRLLGSMRAIRRDALGTYLRASRELGDVVRFELGPPGARIHFYGVFSAEGVHQVLAHESANLTSQDDEYLRQRRLVQPLFTRRQIDQYASVMCDEVNAMLDRWATAPSPTVDLVQEHNRLTLQVVSRVLFGTNVEAAMSVVRSRFNVFNQYVVRRGLSPVRPPLWWPSSATRRALEVRRALYAVCDRIIDERRSAGALATSNDLVTLLANAEDEAGDRLRAREVRDQVLVFLMAGHETTAISLTFAMHLLAKHPDVQTRVRDEVDRVLGDRDPVVTDVEALTYTTMVLKESMRLFPAAPVTARRSVAETEIDGHVLPAGSTVFVAPWVTHRHPAYWDDPERFDPERFTPSAEATRPRYAWFPFGGGPRACIGQYFSMLESVLALAMVVRAYELHAVDLQVPVVQGITLRVTGPSRCRLIPR
jgi:cytochrome P450